MGKFEIQSMPIQRNESNYISPLTTCKGIYFNQSHNSHDHNSLPNGVSIGHTNGLSKLLANNLTKSIKNGLVVNNVTELEESSEALCEKFREIPDDMELLTNQVAGHVINESGGIGMLKRNGQIFKPLLKKDCAEREIQLYEQLKTTVDRSLIEMRALVPNYYGFKKIPIKGKEIDFLILEDLTKEFNEPCIMDIKIGKRTWDPNASYEKIIAEEKKYHECKRDLGFCIPGLQVYKIANNQLVKYGKDYGKSLNKDTAKEVIKEFLNADTHHFCRKLLMQLLASLWQIQHFARSQRRLRLYASSILLVYDARRLRGHIRSSLKHEPVRTPSLVRTGSLYRPLSLATLKSGCERIPTGFSGQLTKEGPILKSFSNKIINLEGPRIANNNNTWQKSIKLLKRTHSFQHNYDKDVQNKKQTYTFILDDLCCETKSEVWATAKLIDFAHVYPADNVDIDKNYLNGVENLVKMFEDFLAQTVE